MSCDDHSFCAENFGKHWVILNTYTYGFAQHHMIGVTVLHCNHLVYNVYKEITVCVAVVYNFS